MAPGAGWLRPARHRAKAAPTQLRDFSNSAIGRIKEGEPYTATWGRDVEFPDHGSNAIFFRSPAKLDRRRAGAANRIPKIEIGGARLRLARGKRPNAR
jgi:hypothetical protein